MDNPPADAAGGPGALTEIELAVGMPLGLEPVAPLRRSPGAQSPGEALEEVLLDALRRPPCLLSFSGGRDSSALLAMATDLARREGLAPPVPATMVFPGSDEANEERWQEEVLRHIGVSDRVLIEITGDTLDAVGPVARGTLARHGLLWPFNAHFHVPIIDEAAGGTLVTGFGGDELGLLSEEAKAERILARRRVRHREDALIVGFALSPRWVRRLVYRRRSIAGFHEMPWLNAAGRREVAKTAARHSASMPLGFDAAVRYFWRGRYLQHCLWSLNTLGADRDVRMVNPFVDPRVLDAVARAGGFRGFGSRTELVGLLFGRFLPDSVVSRETKALFNVALWTDTARAFAQSWRGSGLPGWLIDEEALRSHWQRATPHALSALLLQQAWLHDCDKAQSAGSAPPGAG
jgi:asparagine synthase (glutamine-hydrolysing)